MELNCARCGELGETWSMMLPLDAIFGNPANPTGDRLYVCTACRDLLYEALRTWLTSGAAAAQQAEDVEG